MAAILSVSSCAAHTKVTGSPGVRHPWTKPHVLRIGDIADPDTLNEYFSGMDLVDQIGSLVFSSLVTADPKGYLVGDLAVTVPTVANGGVSTDGKIVTYHLHRGVKWQVGAALTSRDVVFSWQAVMNPDNPVEHREGYDQVASIDAPDDYTVIVHLKRRNPPFVSQFFTSVQEGPKGILPRHLLGRYANLDHLAFNAQPIGSGPFKVARWVRGQYVLLTRNDAYFRGPPKLQAIEIDIYPSSSTLVNEMATHNVDLVVDADFAQYPLYARLSSIRVVIGPSNILAVLAMNDRRPGLNDVAVRRAIAMAIDYDAVIRKLVHGLGDRARDIVPPGALGYTANAPYRYDLRAAIALLDRSGWRLRPDGIREKNGVRLDFDFAGVIGSGNSQALGVLLQQGLRAAGIRLSIKNYSNTVLYAPDGPLWKGTYDLASFGNWLPVDPDNHFYLACDQFTPKGMNDHFFCNPKLDALEAAGLSTDDPTAREAAYHKAEHLIHEDVPYVPLYLWRRVYVMNEDLRNFQATRTIVPWYEIWKTGI